jgi:hypothetical protein
LIMICLHDRLLSMHLRIGTLAPGAYAGLKTDLSGA